MEMLIKAEKRNAERRSFFIAAEAYSAEII